MNTQKSQLIKPTEILKTVLRNERRELAQLCNPISGTKTFSKTNNNIKTKKIRITINNLIFKIARHSISHSLNRAFLKLNKKSLINFIRAGLLVSQPPLLNNHKGKYVYQAERL